MTETLWYHEGLRFSCTGCGDCCTGEAGCVWVVATERKVLAEHLDITVADFERRYVRDVARRKSLIELDAGDCVFFDRKARVCKVYQVRPRQCRTWPFWESNLESPGTWEETCRECPGCGKGELTPLEEIERKMRLVRV